VPTYQYSCTECEHFFEAFQSFTEDSLTECPECQGRLRKVFNAVGVVFKGSGFYRTDSRKTPASSESSSSDSSSSIKSEAPSKSETTSTKSESASSSTGGSSGKAAASA